MTNNDYIELTSPQILDTKWSELNFDLASGPNTLQDLERPESGGGYVYRNARSIGSPTHNRFIYWRTSNDLLELVEISSEMVLDGNQVRIRFANSLVINDINVIEFSDSIVIMIVTLTSIHRLHLPHPKTTNKSVLHELKSDVLFDHSNYYLLSNHSSTNNQQPICSSSWQDGDLVRCAVSFPDSSILIVTFGGYIHQISTTEIKQTGIIGRIWSRMPHILGRSEGTDCENSVFTILPYTHRESGDTLLFTLCKDLKIRIFSTNTKECILTHSLFPHQSFSQSFANITNPVIELPMMRMSQSHIIVYMDQEKPEFIVLSHSFNEGIHELKEMASISDTPDWEKLIDFSVSNRRIWALSEVRGTEPTLCYRNLTDDTGLDLEAIWEFVNFADDLDTSSVRNYVAEIFWRNRFSVSTIRKALAGIVKGELPQDCSLEALEQFAFTRISDNNQEEAWARFHDYCLQNQLSASKNIGLVVSNDESIISIIKRTSPSFVVPWLMGVNMILQGGPYRGIEFSKRIRGVIEPLNYISIELIDEDQSNAIEQKLFHDPEKIVDFIDDILSPMVQTGKVCPSKMNFAHKNLILTGIDYVCEQLDLTHSAQEFITKVLDESRIRSEHNPLESNCGIVMTFELFKRVVRARMTLARDLIIYIQLMSLISQLDESESSEKFLCDLCEEIYTSGKFKSINDSFRSYSVLVWICECSIKSLPSQSDLEVIEYISSKFQFFKTPFKPEDRPLDSEQPLHNNLLMNFLINGGVNFTHTSDSSCDGSQSISDSFYVTGITLNLCKLLWPKLGYICFSEFLLTNHLDEQLDRYLVLTEGFPHQPDRDFIRATNFILQNRATKSVDTFNRLSRNFPPSSLPGRFISADSTSNAPVLQSSALISSTDVHRYYDKLITLFQICNNHQCSEMLINSCLLILDEFADKDQQHWVNCLRAKLFNCQLELEENEEAYQTMIKINDSSLRTNCLRKFIVSHCENEQWSSLLAHPYIDMMDDFIDILNQKASSADLSNLNEDNFYKTSYYDVLFASYISDEEYRLAADVMYNYAQRLTHEVPGVLSIRKQVDCLLIALNSLRCVEEREAYLNGTSQAVEDRRSSVMKRCYDCESDDSIKLPDDSENSSPPTRSCIILCKDIEKMYELTSARLKLLERDQTSNVIALSPLKPEETIAQLVATSMFSNAMDLALLFRVSMEPILEGLTSKYLVLQMSQIDPGLSQNLEFGLADVFNQSYTDIDTYNFVANSTSPLVHRLWRLIDHYLVKYDKSTTLMRVVATKILSTGYDIPASLRRMYMSRNVSELLKLLIKYDRLIEAADLSIEITDRVLASTGFLTVYLPTHLILLLISYLQEDATNTKYIKTSDVLTKKLDKFRQFLTQ